MTSVNAATVGDSNVMADTGSRLTDVTGLLGYKIEVGVRGGTAGRPLPERSLQQALCLSSFLEAYR